MIISRRKFSNNCTWVLLILFSVLLLGQKSLAQEEGQQLLQPFPNASLISTESSEDVVYLVPLGILQRDSGRATPENALRVSGTLTKLLYEVTPGFIGLDVHEYFVQQFEESGLERLFACQGRSCGSSNDWANDVFGNRVLYGPAENQYFMTYVDRSAIRDSYIVSYIITRGNGRLYSYIELIETEPRPLESGVLGENLLRNKYVTLNNLSFTGDELASGAEALLDLVSVLKLNPTLNLFIVAHLQGSDSTGSLEGFQEVQTRSQKRAESVVSALIAAGVDRSRLVAKGIGPLAPRCGAGPCRNTVEAVLR